MMTMNNIERRTLQRNLLDARYKILVALRPLAPARSAFNLTLYALIDTAEAMGDSATIDMVRTLMLEEGI